MQSFVEIADSGQDKLPPPGTLATAGTMPVTLIRPVSGWVSLNLRDLWQYGELLYFLVWRDVKVRYKQTVVGAAWAVLQPLLAMVVFSIFFGGLAKMPSDGVPYPIFAFAALLPWQFFSNALAQSSNSLVANQQLVKKVYFPRLVIPVSAALAGLVDFGIAFIILLGMMLCYGITPSWAILALPGLLLLTVATALAVGLWLSALNVRYRDVRVTVPFLIQLWLFATPVVYPSSMIPEPWRIVYALNPMVGVVEGFRWALLGTPGATALPMAVSIVTVVALLIGGLIYFRRMEQTFADVV